MVVIVQVPEGIKNLVFKKNGPNLIGGLPPVHFVNYPPKKPADKKLSFVKITFPKSVTKKYEMFITGEMKMVIKVVLVHETILTDLMIRSRLQGL